ncbi:MAG: hypothetical protein JWN70_5426 [Planctomycetaceae bacterium]|nr:hypothetical protein [Planctomycetaceae bacterium]
MPSRGQRKSLAGKVRAPIAGIEVRNKNAEPVTSQMSKLSIRKRSNTGEPGASQQPAHLENLL